MRVDYELINILARYDIILCTQFNHPRELTDVAMGVCRSLANRGVMLLNQTPLLKGVNDDLATLKALFKGLIRNKVKPYYLFQCDLNEGTHHFRTNLADSLDLVQGLIGHVSSIAVPTFSVDLVGGGGKVPVLPTYMSGDPRHPYVKFHNYELDRTYEFPNVPPKAAQ
jgi:lysine 2,3-aminomutase